MDAIIQLEKKKKGSSATNPISELLVIILNAFRIENDG